MAAGYHGKPTVQATLHHSAQARACSCMAIQFLVELAGAISNRDCAFSIRHFRAD
jgi:hypothetical protein